MSREISLTLRRAALGGCALALLLFAANAYAGDAGYAIELDGISGYLGCDLAGTIRGCSDITLSAWILPEGPNGDLISPEPRGQAAVGLGFHLGVSAGRVFLAKGNGSGSYVILIGTTSMPISVWHHVAGTFDGSTMRVYVDGLLDGSLADGSAAMWDDLPPVGPPGQTNWPSPAQLYLGADKHNDLGLGPTIPDFDFYEGCIDEAQIWSRALSQGEIDFDRHISLSGTEPGLVAYWKFDEGAGTTTVDASAHGSDLTLHNGATWKISTAPVNVTGVGPIGARPSDRLAAFPNPTAGEVTILLESRSPETGRLTIYDHEGRRMAALDSGLAAKGGGRLLHWDGRDREGRGVASGIYLVRFESASTRLTTRLLVLR